MHIFIQSFLLYLQKTDVLDTLLTFEIDLEHYQFCGTRINGKLLENQFFMIYQFNRNIQFRMEEDDSNAYPRMLSEWDEPQSYTVRATTSSRALQSLENTHQLDDLHKANQRFRLFIDNISTLAYTPIRQDVLAYCSGQKKSEKCLDNVLRPETLIKKMEVRIDKMIKTKRIKRNWGQQDLKILIWIVSKYSEMKQIKDIQKDMTSEDWKFIASIIPGVTPQTCMFKWLSIKKITLATHNWTKNQSEILSKIVSQRLTRQQTCNQVKDWKQISQDLYRFNEEAQKVYRNAKQCRQHWTCYLSPQLKKGPWQLYEDVKLLKFIKDNKGLKKWSQIAKNFQGRTQNALKNRYTLIIEKQKRIPRNKHKPQLTLISQYLQKCYVDQFTSTMKVQAEQNEQSSIYQDESQAKGYQQSSVKCLLKGEEIMNNDTNQSVITPVRVQRVNINDFQSMNIHFFRHIQPGVIESNGTFKKIESNIFKQSSQTQKTNQGKPQVKLQENSMNMIKKGPFSIFPLPKNKS